MATITVLDNMEYESDATAQSVYLSNVSMYGNDDYTKLLLHMDGTDGSTTFTDSSSSSHTLSVYGNAQIDTDYYKFNGASGLFDGNDDYLQIATHSDFNFGTDDFTIDCWIRMSSFTNAFQTIIGNGKTTWSSGCRFFMVFGGTKKVAFGGYECGNPIIESTTVLSLDTWYHVAVTRASNVFRLFVNGTLEATSGTNTYEMDFSTTSTRIGANGWDGTASNFTGRIEELRISKGIARWTSYFSIPFEAYSTINPSTILQSYSESTTVYDSSYFLKGIAYQTTSLNKTLTRTITTPINLTGHAYIVGKIRASRTGSNIKIGFHDSGGTTTEVTPNITSADTWQTIQLDISAVSDVNKDAIDQIIITVVNADYDTTFYLYMLWAISGISEPLFNDATPQRVFIPFRGTSRFLNYTI